MAAFDMPEIHIDQETERHHSWSYQARVVDGEQSHRYDVTLSFADYDLWSRGRAAPERVVKAAFEFLLERESPQQILSRFDCSLIRRYFPEVDQELPKLI